MLKNLIVLPDGTELFSGPGQVNALSRVTLTQSVNSGQELTLGSVCAAMLEARLICPGGNLSIESGTEVTLYKVDDSGVRTQVGLFTLEKPTRSGANTYKLTAYDRVSKLDKDLTDWLAELDAWPYTLFDFAGMVCQACGLTLANDSLPNGDFQVLQFSAQGITGRQLMAWIGEATAKFCRATADGQIEFAWYAQNDTAIGPTGQRFYYQGSLSYEDYQVAPIDKVQIQYSDNDVGVIWPNDTEATNAYKITGNYLLLTDTTDRLLPIARTVYTALKDASYTPGKVTVASGTDIRAGDILSITDANGKELCLYVMTRTQSGQKDTLEATGSQNRDSVTAVNNKRYEALSGKVLNLQTNVEGLKAENKDAAGNLAALALDVDGISAQVSRTGQEVQGLKTEVTSIRQDAQSVSVQIQAILENGVDKVTTETGYTFNADGLTISKSGQEMENRLDNTGMYVTRSGETILQANNAGVVATDVTVRNYLIVGTHARFEDYGTDRTACFFL